MKRIFWLCVWIIAAAFIAYGIVEIPGYVAIQVKAWLVALPLWLAVVLVIVLAVIALWVIRLLKIILGAPARWGLFWQKRRFQKQKKLWKQAVSFWLTDCLSDAEKTFKALANAKFAPQHAWLIAAKCAQQEGRFEAAFQLLDKAEECASKKAELTYKYLTIETLWATGEQEKALDLLSKTQVLYPEHPALLKCQWSFYLAKKRFEELVLLLPKLKKLYAHQVSLWQEMQLMVYQGLLESKTSFVELNQAFKITPELLKQTPSLVLIFAQRAQRFGQAEAAYNLLSSRLQKDWDLTLFVAFCRVATESQDEQLKKAEKWFEAQVKAGNESAELYMAMGELCSKVNLPGKANQYFEKSFACKQNHSGTLLALAEHCVRQNDFEKACQYFQKALG